MTSLTHHDAPSTRHSLSFITKRLPGIALSIGVTVAAYALEAGETDLFGKAG